MPPRTAADPPPASAADQIDRELARRALDKRRRGETPNRQELAALRRVEAAEDERLRWQHYRACPKGHYREMSGRATKILNEQAALYGVPLLGPTVNLAAVVKWLHDLLAKHGRRLLQTVGEDPMSGESSPALERWREEKWRLARLERQEREGHLIARDKVHEALMRLAHRLRQCGDQLQLRCGGEAHQILVEALDDFERELPTLFAETVDVSESPGPESEGEPEPGPG